MPTHDIIDNRKQKLVDHINRILSSTEAARFAVGYFFLSGLESIASRLAGEAQRLHGARRRRVEKFLRDLGTSPAESSSRNPLEQPWALTPDEALRRREILHFVQNDKRGTDAGKKLFTAARDETAALTEQIAKVEKEIDARVTALYGLLYGL